MLDEECSTRFEQRHVGDGKRPHAGVLFGFLSGVLFSLDEFRPEPVKTILSRFCAFYAGFACHVVSPIEAGEKAPKAGLRQDSRPMSLTNGTENRSADVICIDSSIISTGESAHCFSPLTTSS
jgi:hypothetical protein